jgi:hypothetical protein
MHLQRCLEGIPADRGEDIKNRLAFIHGPKKEVEDVSSHRSALDFQQHTVYMDLFSGRSEAPV